jgi:conjugative transfer region lipoprotein (TIGR03751 family)
MDWIETAAHALRERFKGAALACPLAFTLAVTLVATGCTVVAPRGSPLPRDGATMSEIYRQHVDGASPDGTGSNRSSVDSATGELLSPRDRLPRRGADADTVSAERRALSEPLANRFERLPNPDLTLHVFPHLARGRYPVPGYDTVFPMYESVQYALPGEVPPRHRVVSSASPSASPSSSPSASSPSSSIRKDSD